ncbi:MAG: hypothetical protein GX153_04315 [Clostridiaceae bacterium]|nr:hypothetical protein [Clostridiaceae bacterium]
MKRKVWLCLLAALAVLTSPCLPVAAAPVNGTGGIDESPVVVTGLVQALTISVTHPASAEWTIDVNQDTPFAAPSLVVTNHTRCPVEVSVAGLSRNPDCSLPFVDVLPDHFEGWDALDRAESAGYLALGIRVVSDVDTDWMPGFSDTVHWAAAVGDTWFGALPADGTGILRLQSCHGLAFDTGYTARHDLTFRFTLV